METGEQVRVKTRKECLSIGEDDTGINVVNGGGRLEG